MSSLSFSSPFGIYKQKIEAAIKDSFRSFGEKSKLTEACEYALLNGGKRFRPALVLLLADSLGRSDQVMPAALSVEFFHTASLIADDLPCMDNDDMRRDKPAVHKVYGETTALLASYALIAHGYKQLAINTRLLKKENPKSNVDSACVLALENATHNTGLLGATGGQYIDMFPGEKLTVPLLKQIIHKKTVSLFEISFVLGWLFGGGKIDLLEKVKQAAAHFGMAFQIADDLADMDQDLKNGRQINLALLAGPKAASEMLHDEVHKFETTISELGINSVSLHQLVAQLKN